MASPVGDVLRDQRQSRQFSINQLADRAAVAKSTLSRWEAGTFQPRLPELEAVLGALAASPTEREQTLARMRAPRAVAEMRREVAGRAGLTDDVAFLLPAGGDLIRAMRRRRGLSLEEVATRLRVRPSAVSYWEQSKTTPHMERLSALCDLLGAQPEERAVLADGQCFMALPERGQ